MTIPEFARRVCPPFLWELLAPATTPAGLAAAVDPALLQVGADSTVACQIERRYHGRGRVTVGADSKVVGLLVLECERSEIRIGNNSLVSEGTLLAAVESITIEDDVLISFGCRIMDSDSHSLSYKERRGDLQRWRQPRQFDFGSARTRPVRICQGAWIGADVTILKGVRVGTGAIVGAGSVVVSDVPDWTVVAGNPARVVRTLPEDMR